jgi:DNA (cytosine-5)-methyltransferase 1
MKHIDLFSGIGGFALAAEWAFGEVEHIFCDHDTFCQEVLKKHWPNSKIYGDIRSISKKQLIADSRSKEPHRISQEPRKKGFEAWNIDLLTGGFPCQPFSQAGRRGGTEDDRYLCPEMFRVICDFKPTWVLAENVRGLVTWNEGMVLEQVCSDLESQDYEVQPIIIPAVALNAPHRRDRIWFIAHRRQQYGKKRRNEKVEENTSKRTSCESDTERCSENDSHTKCSGLEGTRKKRTGYSGLSDRNWSEKGPDWTKDWFK